MSQRVCTTCYRVITGDNSSNTQDIVPKTAFEDPSAALKKQTAAVTLSVSQGMMALKKNSITTLVPNGFSKFMNTVLQETIISNTDIAHAATVTHFNSTEVRTLARDFRDFSITVSPATPSIPNTNSSMTFTQFRDGMGILGYCHQDDTSDPEAILHVLCLVSWLWGVLRKPEESRLSVLQWIFQMSTLVRGSKNECLGWTHNFLFRLLNNNTSPQLATIDDGHIKTALNIIRATLTGLNLSSSIRETKISRVLSG